MIYILTGVAKSGKTLLCRKINKEYGIPYFSTDYVMMMLSKVNKNLNIDINASDSTVAKDIEPYLYRLIETMVENNETYLLEGVHFNTDFSVKLMDTFEGNIKILYLGYREILLNEKLNELYHFKEQMENPWIFDHLDEKIEDIVAYLIRESDRIYNECIQKNLEYIEVSNIILQSEQIISKLLKKSLNN